MQAHERTDNLLTISASELVRYFWNEARSLYQTSPIDPVMAAALVLEQFGPELLNAMIEEGSTPAYIAAARLAVAFWDRLVAHRLAPRVAERVRGIRLSTVPENPPLLLQKAWLMEVQSLGHEERLFGETTALGAYYDPQTEHWSLIGWMWIDGEPRIRAMAWKQEWSGAALPELDLENSDYEWQDGAWVSVGAMTEIQLNSRRTWFHDAVQFAVVFGALLEAEQNSLNIRDEEPKQERKEHPRRGVPRPPNWITRHIDLNSTAPNRSPAEKPEKPLSKDGLFLVDVPVREFLRLQPCGKGNLDRKWIVVPAHPARRWVSPKPKRLIVDTE